MNGVLFMIRILLILIILTSCGNLPITYIQNFSSVNNVVFGFPDYKITQEIFDEYEFSFIKVRFGSGPHSILVLAYINEDIFEWVGEDAVRIFTKNGRVIKTEGLEHNLEILRPRNNIIEDEESIQYESLNLYNPDLFLAVNESSATVRNDQIRRLGSRIEVLKVIERNSVSSIGWKYKNLYYKNVDSDDIFKVEQHIHPRLPVLKVEYYYKF